MAANGQMRRLLIEYGATSSASDAMSDVTKESLINAEPSKVAGIDHLSRTHVGQAAGTGKLEVRDLVELLLA